ncbi:hypothetical protein VNO78_35491 [Psophocarpus tetragonolobus]|uniref:Uncharacterized protein n=1 Tax=Psophocarpus tetragonolobus TaxID=3891 RepID=A0AAN9RLG1_PSOTE
MVHGILQFTPSIAFRYVLHRCKSRDIRCAESHFASCVVTTPAGHRLRVPKNRPLQFQFPWHTKRRGSPTETLLRLLLPLNDKVQWTSHNVAGSKPPTVAAIRTLHRTIQSVGATGGVYKGQGRSQRELIDSRLLGIPR